MQRGDHTGSPGQLDAMEARTPGKDTSEDVYHCHQPFPVLSTGKPSSCWDDGRRAMNAKPTVVLSS